MIEEVLRVISVTGIPALALFLSIGLLVYKLIVIDYEIYVAKKHIIKLILVWTLITLPLFLGLIFLTGGVNKYYYVQNSFVVNAESFQFGFGNQYLILVPTYQFLNFLVIAILTGMVYATTLSLPKICTRIPTETLGGEKMTKAGASISTASAATSALASVSVCCTTSVVSLLIPAVASILGPITPFLLVLSQGMLVYTIHKTVYPRFGIKFL